LASRLVLKAHICELYSGGKGELYFLYIINISLHQLGYISIVVGVSVCEQKSKSHGQF